MAPNPIVVAKANELYPHLHFNFMTWLKGSCVPALVCAALLPLLLAWSSGVFKSKSDINQTEQEGEQPKLIGDDIIDHAKKELAEMGSMTLKEWQLCCVLFICLLLWVTAGYTNIDSTLVALVGIVFLLHMATMDWKDIASNRNAVRLIVNYTKLNMLIHNVSGRLCFG
jgi:DASS family divalent anion:Na+ symporter